MKDLEFKEIRFEKSVEFLNKIATAIIILKFGKNRKGDYIQRVNQVNTSNEEVNKSIKPFEELNISVKDMTSLIINQGYKIKKNA